MAKVKVTKKEADRLMKIEDQTKGVIVKTLADYIIEKKGEKGIKMVEKRLKELGYPMKFKECSTYTWYPGSFDALITLVILEVFSWDEKKAYDIGYDSLVVHSLGAKLLLTRFVSLELAMKNAQKFWHFFSYLGEVKFTKYDIDKSWAILRLDNYTKIHPLEYDYVRGSLAKILEIMTNSKKVNIEQTKSLYHNDTYDEFKITWK